MSLNSIDIVNLQSDIKAFKVQWSNFVSSYNDLCALLIRIEYFLSHYDDSTVQDDLPF